MFEHTPGEQFYERKVDRMRDEISNLTRELAEAKAEIERLRQAMILERERAEKFRLENNNLTAEIVKTKATLAIRGADLIEAKAEIARLLGVVADKPLLSEHDLKKLLLDPAYWRDNDPKIVEKVREGFRKLYPE